MKQIKTGVPGLDDVFKGGVHEGSSVLITGAPGTGKTILALQFLHEGLKNKEPCLYISCEESADSLRSYAKGVGLDIEKYEDGLLSIYEQDLTTKKIISIESPLNEIRKRNIKRIVLDSLTLFEYVYYESEIDFRKGVLEFLRHAKKMGATIFATSESLSLNIDEMKYSAQEFLFEGLIHLSMIRKGSNFERTLNVSKMKGQSHLLDIFPISLTDKGMQVHTDQLPFSLIERDYSKKG
ncbi:MAG TPA: ATPase domain-containing protein [Candidatus Nanoarchaeia archaeon]|nr:ATPase domain-containing protein [Candidatus Nanoarchaeia archaeon]